MSLTTWLAFVAVDLAACLSPGPAVLFVVGHALRRGFRASLWATLGILAGNVFYLALSAVGLVAVLAASRGLFTVVKWGGAVYLVYLGLRLIVSPTAGPAEPEADTRPGRRVVRDGFVLQAANPKAVVFFAALLPQFVDPAAPVSPQLGVLAATSLGLEFVALGCYGAAAGRLSVWARRPGVAEATGRVSGALLVGAGVGLGLGSDR